MSRGAVYRQSKVLIPSAWRAESAFDRMRGLLGRPPLKQGEALLIDPCSSVHTIGMGYTLDVVFVDAGEKIVKLCRRVAPLRMAFAFGARATLELPAGEIDRLELAVGDRLEWRH
jgi:uncharacterized membrane protein (UPF0127 family)